MKKYLIAGCASLFLTFSLANAGSVTVREVELKGNSTEILLDSAVDKGSIQVDFVRDIVQFSISNATIYPAKMLHADQASYSKVFAYQYSPSLVRVRFSVDQAAEQFKNKIKWSVDGKKVLIHFSQPTAIVDQEKSLLEKITASVDSKEEKKEAKKEEKKTEVAAQSNPLNLGGANKKQIKLAGAKSGPSAFRSFLAMFLVVGGLGLVLLYVKRRNAGGIQAKKANNNWFTNLLPQNRKQKPMMEVVATHVLGPKQSIVVMKIRGHQFVLAVTAENIQLITQLDADESELDLLDDPKVAASIGKMFGVDQNKPAPKPVISAPSTDVNFNTMLKNSNGAGAIIARNAYNTQAPVVSPVQNNVETVKPGIAVGGARDIIRKRLESLQ